MTLHSRGEQGINSESELATRRARPVSPLLASVIVAAGVVLVNWLLPGPPSPSEFTVDCEEMIERQWWQPADNDGVTPPVSRFAPHQQQRTELDFLATPPSPRYSVALRSISFRVVA